MTGLSEKEGGGEGKGAAAQAADRAEKATVRAWIRKKMTADGKRKVPTGGRTKVGWQGDFVWPEKGEGKDR